MLLVVCSVPADCGWWPTSDGGFGAMMGVWLSPFSAGSVTLWSTLDSEGASLPASTCQSHQRFNIWTNQLHTFVNAALTTDYYFQLITFAAKELYTSFSSPPHLQNLNIKHVHKGFIRFCSGGIFFLLLYLSPA